MIRFGVRRRGDRSVMSSRVVFRWDLDKTYLKGEFDSLRGLVKIPFEKAEDKIAAPGVVALIRALRDAGTRGGREVRIYFISASPPQIGRAIKEKLELDGIAYDGIVFKNQLQRLMRGKFRHLREHVGFKLTELLKAHSADPPVAAEYLFGDDWESDPLIYSLYADVVAGRLGVQELSQILGAVRVDPPLVEEACALSEQFAGSEVVRRIFINLERRTPPANFRSFGGRLVPTFNYLQTAACLYQEGVLDQAGVAEVAHSLRHDSAYSPERLTNSLTDIERRGHLSKPSAVQLLAYLRDTELLPTDRRTRAARWQSWWARLWARRRALQPTPLAAGAALIDYRAVVGMEPPADSRCG